MPNVNQQVRYLQRYTLEVFHYNTTLYSILYIYFLFTHSVVIKTERERGEREIRELIDNKLTAV